MQGWRSAHCSKWRHKILRGSDRSLPRENMGSPERTSVKPNLSAGILAYRRGKRGLEVLLAHPGGHNWRNRDNERGR
jgi:hypothetical protein